MMAEFLACESFPRKDWNELSQEEPKQMTRFYRKKVPPLPMPDVWSLEAFGFLDRFKAMAKESQPVIEDVPPGEKPMPVKRVPVLAANGDARSSPCVF